jgi:hypothetical protein
VRTANASGAASDRQIPMNRAQADSSSVVDAAERRSPAGDPHTSEPTAGSAGVGDWLEVHAPQGMPPRRGQVTEVIGAGAHLRYRVRWDETHESVYYPPAGVAIVRRARDMGAPRSWPMPARPADPPTA